MAGHRTAMRAAQSRILGLVPVFRAGIEPFSWPRQTYSGPPSCFSSAGAPAAARRASMAARRR